MCAIAFFIFTLLSSNRLLFFTIADEVYTLFMIFIIKNIYKKFNSQIIFGGKKFFLLTFFVVVVDKSLYFNE